MNQNNARDLLIDFLSKNSEVHYGTLPESLVDEVISEIFLHMDHSERIDYIAQSKAEVDIFNDISLYLSCHPDRDLYVMISNFRENIRPLFKQKIDDLIIDARQYMIDSNYYEYKKGEFNED